MAQMKSLTLKGKYYEIADEQARRAIERDCASTVKQTIEGAGVSASDCSEKPICGLRLFGKTVQHSNDTPPTPDNPQDLDSVVNPTIKVVGGNLIPAVYADGASKTMNGVVFTALSDGGVLVNGTATELAYYSFNYTGNKISLPSGWLSVSSGLGCGTGIPQIKNDIYVDDVYVTSVQTVNESSSRKQFDGKVELGASRIKVDAGVRVNNQVVYPMLCAFENPIDYERPKATQTISLARTLHGLPVPYGGNYKDSAGQQWTCDEIDFEKGVYIQRIGITDLTDAVWTVNSNNQFFTTLDSNKYVAGSSVLCSHLVGGTDIYINAVNAIRANAVVGDGSAEALSTALSGATLLAVLITPIVTPLSTEELNAYQQLYSNYKATTVVNNENAWMELEYSTDLAMWIEKCIFNTSGSVDADIITTAVNDYLEKNPVSSAKATIENGVLKVT